MKIHKTGLEGVCLIEPAVYADARGWFMEVYSKLKMGDLGIRADFIQDNHSFSVNKGTLRGLHFQNDPRAQSKLIRCTRGAILDVIVDIRRGSPTYGRHEALELTASGRKLIFIPKGFAHGFLTLADDTEVEYKVDEYYSPEHDRSLRFDDPDLKIDWGVADPILSEKDSKAPFLSGSDCNFIYTGPG